MGQVEGKAGAAHRPSKGASAPASPFAAIEDAVRKQLAEINAIGEISVHSPDIIRLFLNLLQLTKAARETEEHVHKELARILRVVRKLEKRSFGT